MVLTCCLTFLIFILFAVLFTIQVFIHCKRVILKRSNKAIAVGLFHPYCNAGGGGERVLWTAICSIQKQYKNANCVVYSGDNAAPGDILKNVEERFNIKLLRNIEIIHLRTRFLVEAKYYPFCTLLMQSLGSLILGLEAIVKFIPDIYIDTMGYAWTLPIFKLLGWCRVCAYVHFPTISTDMLNTVETRMVAVNNREFISNSKFFSRCKLIYYNMFAYLYGLVGRQAEVIMVNSSWTRAHILDVWRKPQYTFTVYPPCDISEFNSIPLDVHEDKARILSIAQFRPEKNHELQIRAFHSFLSKLSDTVSSPILVLLGSCRHKEDYRRVKSLKDLCFDLEISHNVEFKVNLPFQDVMQEMRNASVALHTMRDEHFGIGIVECMSAGLVIIAHDSGGPKMDIVVDYNSKRTGFLATDVDSFADAMERLWKMNKQDLYDIRKNARDSVSRFSVQKFEESFLSAIKLVFV